MHATKCRLRVPPFASSVIPVTSSLSLLRMTFYLVLRRSLWPLALLLAPRSCGPFPPKTPPLAPRSKQNAQPSSTLTCSRASKSVAAATELLFLGDCNPKEEPRARLAFQDKPKAGSVAFHASRRLHTVVILVEAPFLAAKVAISDGGDSDGPFVYTDPAEHLRCTQR